MVNICDICQLYSVALAMRKQNIISIASSIVENVFFSGVMLGWPSLQYVLLQEDYFQDMCSELDSNFSISNVSNVTSAPADINFCPGRDASLHLAFTLALSLQYITSYFFGLILDKYGTFIYRLIGSILFAVGYAMLAVSTPQTSWLVITSSLLLAIAGTSISTSNIQLANLAGSFKGLVISLQCGAYTSAASVFLIVKEAYKAGYSFRGIFSALSALSVLTLVRSFLLMPKKVLPQLSPSLTDNIRYGWEEWPCLRSLTNQNIMSSRGVRIDQLVGKNPESCDSKDACRPRSFKESLKSKMFQSNLFAFCVGHMRLTFYIGSFVNWIKSFQSSNNVEDFVSTFNLVFLAGVVLSPFCGLLFDGCVHLFRRKSKNSWLAILKALCLFMLINSAILSFLSLTTVNHLTLTSIIAALLSEMFVYAGNWSFLGIVFPVKHCGKLLGITQVCGGLSAMLSYAFFQLAIRYDKEFYYLHILFAVVTCLSFIHPFVLYRNAFKKQEET